MSFPTYRSVEEAQREHEACGAKILAAIADYRECCANSDTSNRPFRAPGEDPATDLGWFTPEEQQ